MPFTQESTQVAKYKSRRCDPFLEIKEAPPSNVPTLWDGNSWKDYSYCFLFLISKGNIILTLNHLLREVRSFLISVFVLEH